MHARVAEGGLHSVSSLGSNGTARLTHFGLTRRSRLWTPRPKMEGSQASSWMTTRTARTRLTSPARVSSLSTTSEATPKRKRGNAVSARLSPFGNGLSTSPPSSCVPSRPKGRNRKLWKDEGRWEHDKFREEEQAPKSRQELIASYGYDIRNGERPFAHRRPR